MSMRRLKRAHIPTLPHNTNKLPHGRESELIGRKIDAVFTVCFFNAKD